MIVIIACALLTVLVLNILLAPMMMDKLKQKQGWMLLVFITLSAMGIYLWRGAPDIPSQSALFETQSVNFDKRNDVKKELALMQDLANAPQDIEIMLALGSVRLKNGRLDQAITVLTMAHDKDSAHDKVNIKLGAAHYAAALSALLLDDNKTRAAMHFDKALSIAPEDAPYHKKLLRNIEEFQEDGP